MRSVSGRMSTMVALCQAPTGGIVGCGAFIVGSVAVVSLLVPRVAPVVVAPFLPEAGLVVIE